MQASSAPPEAGDELLRMRQVSRTFDVSTGLFGKSKALRAVDHVDFSVHRGEVVAIVGESGCGKTTLMKLMLGLLRPSSGRVELVGKDITSLDSKTAARHVQPVFQDPYSSLNPRKRIGSIVEFLLNVHRLGESAQRRARAVEMLRRCGLPRHFADNHPNQLSGGQRQRVAIARALVMNPDLVICDEPTSALDVSVQAQILNLLADLRAEFGLTYVVISHNLAVVENIATRVVVMYLGRIVEEAPTEDLFARPRHPYTRALLSAVLTPDPSLSVQDPKISGQFPNPLDPPSGCSFHPRCPAAMAICRSSTPSLSAGVACHLYDAAGVPVRFQPAA